MSRRSTPQSKFDEERFPIRLRLIVPPEGFGLRLDDAFAWLMREVGHGDYAWHASGNCVVNGAIRDRVAIYFRRPKDLAAFCEMFPDFKLADEA